MMQIWKTRKMKASICFLLNFYWYPYSIAFNVFAIDEESTSDDDSIIGGDDAVESEDESEADEPIEDFEK